MTHILPQDDENLNRAFPLVGDLYSYIAVLMQRAPGQIAFRTGAGRIFRDLLLHWPALEEWEDEAQEICQRIADAIYPLTASLYAQAVEITAMISATPVAPPPRIDALSTYMVFDMAQKTERHYSLSPETEMPDFEELNLPKGIAVLCRPLHYRYHTIKDDRQRTGHPHAGIFEMSERLINEMLALPNFVPRDKIALNTVKTDLHQMPKTLARAELSRDANLAVENRHLSHVVPTIALVTSLSALPPPIRAFERRLMTYVTDKSLSPPVRLGLRQVAQNLRGIYPQAILGEAAHAETAPAQLKKTTSRPAPKPKAQAKPAATPRAKPTESIQLAPLQTPRPMSAPLSTHPSVLLPVAPPPATPLPAFLQRPVTELRPAAMPAQTARPVPQPALQASARTASPSVSRPNPDTPRATSPQQEAKPAAQRPSENTRQETRPAPARQPAEQARPQQAARSPEPQIQQQQKPQTPQARPAPKQEAAPQTAPSWPAQEQKTGPEISPRITRGQKQSFTPVSDARPANDQASFDTFAHSAAHHFEEMETRPRQFYDSLKSSTPFPKAVPVSGAGKLDKVVQRTLDKPFRAPTLPARRLAVEFPVPGFGPGAFFLRGK